jgi:hypothetical protein
MPNTKRFDPSLLSTEFDVRGNFPLVYEDPYDAFEHDASRGSTAEWTNTGIQLIRAIDQAHHMIAELEAGIVNATRLLNGERP